jgi:hypothetical protein
MLRRLHQDHPVPAMRRDSSDFTRRDGGDVRGLQRLAAVDEARRARVRAQEH